MAVSVPAFQHKVVLSDAGSDHRGLGRCWWGRARLVWHCDLRAVPLRGDPPGSSGKGDTRHGPVRGMWEPQTVQEGVTEGVGGAAPDTDPCIPSPLTQAGLQSPPTCLGRPGRLPGERVKTVRMRILWLSENTGWRGCKAPQLLEEEMRPGGTLDVTFVERRARIGASAWRRPREGCPL